MATWVILLRAVNLGAKNRVPMADLRKAMCSNGFSNVQSYLQSGNLVADHVGPAEAVRHATAQTIDELTGLSIEVVVRTAEQWPGLIAANPFPEAADQPKLLHAYLLSGRPEVGVEVLADRLTPDDRVGLVDDVLYVDHAAGVQASKLTAPVLAKRLGVSATARNWNTVRAINDLLERRN